MPRLRATEVVLSIGLLRSRGRGRHHGALATGSSPLRGSSPDRRHPSLHRHRVIPDNPRQQNPKAESFVPSPPLPTAPRSRRLHLTPVRWADVATRSASPPSAVGATARTIEANWTCCPTWSRVASPARPRRRARRPCRGLETDRRETGGRRRATTMTAVALTGKKLDVKIGDLVEIEGRKYQRCLGQTRRRRLGAGDHSDGRRDPRGHGLRHSPPRSSRRNPGPPLRRRGLGRAEHLKRSRLIELGANELAARIDWP